MKKQTVKIIKSGLFSGILYAIIIAGFDYFRGKDFDIWKFLLGFLFFGFFMGLASNLNHKKQRD